MDWEEFREVRLRGYGEARGRGEVDPPIAPLLDTLNTLPFLVTLSSCSGRILLLRNPPDDRKMPKAFIERWHREVSTEEVLDALSSANMEGYEVWFKMEPFILHVAFEDLPRAEEFLRLAQTSGFKHSGIISLKRFPILEIKGSECVSAPLSPSLSPSYLSLLVSVANRRLRRNFSRVRSFFSRVFDYYGLTSPPLPPLSASRL